MHQCGQRSSNKRPCQCPCNPYIHQMWLAFEWTTLMLCGTWCQFSVQSPAILTVVFHGFHCTVPADVMIYLKLSRD
jgi:hypothetical protein